MNEEQQQDIEQAQPAVETDGTSTEDKKSTKAKDKTTNTDTKDDKPTNTKSQIFISSELKGKLGDLKKNTDKCDTFDDTIQMLYDFYSSKNPIAKINNINDLGQDLLNAIDSLSSMYSCTYTNGSIGYIDNNNSLLYKLIACIILQRSITNNDNNKENKRLSKEILEEVQLVVYTINKLMTTLNKFNTANITDDFFKAEYKQYIAALMNSKITINQQTKENYMQMMNNLDNYNNIWSSILAAINY